MAEITAKKVILKSSNGQYVLPYVQPATTDALGTVKPDGVTITAAADGTISAAGGGSSYRPPLLSSIWSDHLLDNISWLRADTFSWHSGDVYSAVYNELLSQWNDWWQSHSASEVEGENGFGFLRTAKGYKIAGPENEQAIINTFESKGVAWYYILDIQNRRFKLPRTKFGFTGLRTAVGDYVAPGLPNISGTFTNNGYSDYCSANGAFSVRNSQGLDSNNGKSNNGGYIDFSASSANAIYGAADTVQPPATQMYLYFYVGNYTQSALEQTAGLNAELFNGKQDVLGNNVDYVVDSYSDNNGNWYRLYKSGWLEQGGWYAQPAGNITISLLKPFPNTKYTLAKCDVGYDARVSREEPMIYNRTATGFTSYFGDAYWSTGGVFWVAFGQGA